MLLKKLDKPLCIDRALDDIVRNNAIQRKDREDRISLPPYESSPLNAALPFQRPTLGASRGTVILGGLVEEHQHVRIGCDVRNAVHICRAQQVIAL